MQPNDFMQRIIKDLAIELTEEFDRNFERQAFFDQPWQQRKYKPGGNILNVHGGAGLRGSIMHKVVQQTITWTSSLPYANIHNEGGKITVTAKMKGYFWYRHRQAKGAITTKANGTQSNSKRNNNLSTEAQMWLALALMKIGSQLSVPQRQYIGNHPQVNQSIQRVADANVKRLGDHFGIQINNINKL
jgi:phage gpG-like protein